MRPATSINSLSPTLASLLNSAYVRVRLERIINMKRLTVILLSVFGLVAPLALADEAKCPISGKAVDPECKVNVNGKDVAFCCGNCKSKFEQTLNTKDAGPGACPISGEPADKATRMLISTVEAVHVCCNKCAKKYAEDQKLAAIKDDGAGKCPVSGKPADADVFVVDQGRKQYFCCDNCKAKYVKEHNVVMIDKGAGKCPISGEDATGGPVVYHVKTEAAYTCCEKCAAKLVKEKVLAKL